MSGEGTVPPSVPAGWYPDPADPTGKRWWDGARWTTDVQAAPPAPAPQTFAERPPLTRGAIVVEDHFERTHDYARATTETGISHTRAGWWISAQPLWDVVPQVILIGVIQSFTPLSQPWLSLGIVGINVLLLAVLVALAFSDRRGLLAGGNGSAASPWWILLSPFIYLIMRSREISHYEVGGWSGLIWWIVAAVLAPIVALLGYFGVIGLAVN